MVLNQGQALLGSHYATSAPPHFASLPHSVTFRFLQCRVISTCPAVSPALESAIPPTLERAVPQATGHKLARGADPVQELCDSYATDPDWWVRQVRKACDAFQKDLQAWARHRQLGEPAAVEPPQPPPPQPFSCVYCGACFRLRKHLAAHQARAHQVYSVVRHFTPVPYCLACHKFYHTITRTQYRMKRSPKCPSDSAHGSPHGG